MIKKNSVLSPSYSQKQLFSYMLLKKYENVLLYFVRRTVALFESTTVCKTVSFEVSNHLHCLLDSLPKPQFFAVRSSAVGEDSEDLSSAGQNKTLLGVRGELADILVAIQSCWASLYTLQSVQYRR